MADDTSKSSGGKKASTKKTTTKAAKKSSSSSGSSSRKRAPRAEPSRRMSGSQVAEAAAQQLAELTSKDIEGVTALRRDDDGWQVELEVLELRRIPATTDVMAVYEVQVDDSGELQGYRRGHRYVRGQAEDGS